MSRFLLRFVFHFPFDFVEWLAWLSRELCACAVVYVLLHWSLCCVNPKQLSLRRRLQGAVLFVRAIESFLRNVRLSFIFPSVQSLFADVFVYVVVFDYCVFDCRVVR